LAGMSTGFTMLLGALLIGGIGSSTQHTIASSLVARSFAGPYSLRALGAYNFAGDLGKMTLPAVLSLMLLVMAWRPALGLLGILGIAIAAMILFVAPRYEPEDAATSPRTQRVDIGREPQPFAFGILTALGVIDSATRMGFLLFLPFVLTDKGATLQTVGLAMTLVFAGGAAGKLVCAFIGARIGVIATVWLTEGLTAAGIIALFPLPLWGALILLPLIGVALNGTSSVLYGSVPDLVRPQWRTRALSIFYTGTIGSSAIAPVLFGRVGDALGVWHALELVAAFVLLTLPLAALLRRPLSRQ
jgi:FSR family fosmidomycin resistance protein-like MFS transporter